MKKIIFIITIAIAAVCSFTGCEKEDRNNNVSTSFNNEEITTSKGSIVVFYFTWDEWGRKKKNCNGGGLCNFRLESVEIQLDLPQSSLGHVSPVYKDDNDNYYVNIPIDNDFNFEDETKSLYVDEDIETKGPDGNYYTLKAAAYPYKNNIGDLGGYTLPLEKK